MDREAWKRRYKQRMIDAGVDAPLATEAAEISVALAEESDGPNVENWDDQESCADDEMSYWGD